MTKDTALTLVENAFAFIHNLNVFAALIKVGAAIHYDPTLVRTPQKGSGRLLRGGHRHPLRLGGGR
ncbi:hypothetical protein [Luteibacter yeojuensis]|uniref:hypothetical protein n=1 Tax=Luteibacter yeojuensis TaxID=345309 RepID=UPI000B322C53|nr:hypothetical protein [Luteibacter yeojuensis]